MTTNWIRYVVIAAPFSVGALHLIVTDLDRSFATLTSTIASGGRATHAERDVDPVARVRMLSGQTEQEVARVADENECLGHVVQGARPLSSEKVPALQVSRQDTCEPLPVEAVVVPFGHICKTNKKWAVEKKKK